MSTESAEIVSLNASGISREAIIPGDADAVSFAERGGEGGESRRRLNKTSSVYQIRIDCYRK